MPAADTPEPPTLKPFRSIAGMRIDVTMDSDNHDHDQNQNTTLHPAPSGIINNSLDTTTSNVMQLTPVPSLQPPSPGNTPSSFYDGGNVSYSNISMKPTSPKLKFDRIKSTSRRSIRIQSKSSSNSNAARILNLHRLIKKFTILVWIMIIKDFAWTLCVFLISTWWYLELVWPALIQVICLFLMFGIADKYWKWLRKYFICYVCYRCCKGKDIASKNCLCFC